MDELRRHMTARVYSYMDDIVLASSSEEAHLRDLDNFFEVLEQYGLTVALEKCRFAEPEAKYLGFIVDEFGFRPDPKCLEAIRNFQPPTNPSALKSFLGALGYLRSFIKGFAEIARPLHELSGEDKITEWKPEHETSFRTLIERATTAPVLAAPKLGRPFVIETDFSSKAVSAVLFQADDDGKLHPIRYASRVCNKHEAAYPSVEGEALAIAYAVEEYRPYIEGAPTTTVRTDSSALRALMRRKDLHGRLAKYQTMIQSFDLDIVHRSGKSNLLADHLSRYPAPATSNAVQVAPDTTNAPTTNTPLEIPGVTPPTVDFHRVRAEQKLVPELRAIYDAIVNNKWPDDAARRRRLEKIVPLYAVRNEMVHRQDPDDDGDIPRIEVPYVLRQPLINEFHASALHGAHLGIDKTYDRMRRRVHWDGMKADIAAAVSSCSVCQRRQNKPPYFTEPLHPINPPRFPFQRVHIDILKLPRTTRGNGYVLACQDAFTKWLVTSAMPDQAAPTVAQAFIDDVLTKFGTPHTVVSDQGKQFTGTVFQELSRLFGFRHKTTTTYNPQSNGQIERQNRTLTNMLGSFAERSGKDWDRYLSLVTSAFNNSVQETTKQTPFYMNFAREVRLPLDIALSTPPPRVHSDVSVFLDQTQSALKSAWEIASSEIVKAQDKQKRQADQHNRAAERPIQPQDLVLYYRTQPPAEEAHKLRQPFTGPYRVLAVRHPNVTLRALDDEARPFTTHINKVKPYAAPQTLPLRRQRYDNFVHTDDALLSNAENVPQAGDDIPTTRSSSRRQVRPLYDDDNVEQSADESEGYDDTELHACNHDGHEDDYRRQEQRRHHTATEALTPAPRTRQQAGDASRRRSEGRVRELLRLHDRLRERVLDEPSMQNAPVRRSHRLQDRQRRELERIRDELERMATEH
ncbi:hypothetical protein AAVH_12773 [Aphelenchoides avenae]|nr:hypothetical protein AAVH_12773 [Aphelenchus avenae]